MDIDDLLRVSDEQNEGNSENSGGLQVEFDENSNKAVMASSKAGEAAANGVLPSFTLDGVDQTGDPTKPEDVKDGAGADEKPPEAVKPGGGPDSEVPTEVKVGGAVIPVPAVGEETVFGRDTPGINDPKVSKRHAVIGRDEKGLYVMDLGSTNGTHVTRGDGEPERIAAHTKVYVNEVTKIHFSRSGPAMDGGAPKPAKVEAPKPPAPKEGDTVVAKAPPDVRPVPEIGGQAVVNPDRIQRELTHAKISGTPELISSDGEREVYRAKVVIDGQEREVVLRHTNNRDAADQARKELAAYELAKELGISGSTPTSVREFEVNGVRKFGTIQMVDQGKNLESELRSMAEKKYGNTSDESVKKLVEENPKLKAAIEKAVAQRVVFGDKAFEAKDFVIREVNGEFAVSSRGIERGFATTPNPAMESKPGDIMSATLQGAFSGKDISPEVRARVVEFLKKYNNNAGYENLTELGLSEKEIDHMMARAKVIAEGGKFPVAEVKTPGVATDRDAKVSASLLFNLSVSRRGMNAEIEFKTKEQVAAHMERVLDWLDEKKKLNNESRAEFKQLIEAYRQGDPKAVKLVHAELALTFKVEQPGTAAVEAVADTSVKDLEQKALTPEQKAAVAEKLIANGTFRTLLGEAGISEDKAKQLEKDLFSKDKAVQDKAKAEIAKAYEKKGGYKAFVAEAKGRAGAVALVAGPVVAALLGSDN